MKKFVLCGIQPKIQPLKIEKNVRYSINLIKDIYKKSVKPDLIVFPETVTTGFSLLKQSQSKNNESLNKVYYELKHKLPNIISEIKIVAKQLKTNILFPTYEPSNIKNKFYNSAFFVSSDDGLVGVYRKIFLFPTETWSIPGKKPVLWKTNFVNFGCVICFDGDFPELVRDYTLSGAELVVRPSAFFRDYNIWALTNRSRAYENQIYFCGVNAIGADYAEKNFYGHSMVVDPYARIIKQLGANEEYFCLNIEPKSQLDTSNVVKIEHIEHFRKGKF